MSRRRPLLWRSLLAAAALAAVFAASAFGELTQKGDLFIRFDGGISPAALPREELVPIAVRMEGTIKSLGGEHPPALRQIRIALNREGRLETSGLPRCHQNKIDPATPAQALAACGLALVGGGGFTAKTAFPDQANTLTAGEILLFNSVVEGHPAILAHVYQPDPGPITRVFVFRIRHSKGTFGTILTGEFPAFLNRNAYLKSIFLQIQRRYTFRGRQRAYLNASCPAPKGFSEAPFPFAKVSMTFGDGRILRSTLTRSCKVKR